MKLLVLIPLLIFYGAYIAKTILLRKQGITVNRLARGLKPAYTRRLELLLLVVTYGMAVLQCLGVFEIIPTLPTNSIDEMIGLAVALAGCLLFIGAIVAMKNSWRAGVDNSQKTELRTGGILRWSRNPAFLGFDLFYIGVAVMMPHIFLFVFVAVALVVFHLQILEEEKHLSAAFGTDYMLYKQNVRRYL